jgi:formylglycine-generating enzyme required for sulfatase activity
MEMLKPYEFHASTSELVRMLEKGHKGVALDTEAWQRIYLWIDINAPWRGKWDHPELSQRRIDLAKQYAGNADDPETEYDKLLQHFADLPKPEFIMPPKREKPTDTLTAANWPFDSAKADEMQAKLFDGNERTILVALGDNVTMRLTKIPAGEFVMGSLNGAPDEYPRSVQRIEKPFWIGTTEVTNRQYETFDPDHDTGYLDEDGKDHTTPGYIANHPDQPVARISWNEAKKFCDWLGGRLDMKVDLPTEVQWEWAARAGSAEQFPWGNRDADWSKHANLADASRRFLYTYWPGGSLIHYRRPYPEDSVYPLRDDRYTDSWFIADYVAQSQPNAWGLYDMIGNVSEWTKSDYPHGEPGRKIARGGSWIDRPKVSGNSVKFPYLPHQKVYDVGFRIVINDE